MLAALALAFAAVQPGSNDRPNVVFILADDLGFGDLSAMRQYGGAEDVQTPHIDSIFADGLTFTNFYANCTVCSPTRAALMTGRFPASVGVPGVIRPWPEDNWGYLSPDATLLPAYLKRAGYETALIGKWHLGGEPHNGAFNDPLRRGFDLFRGFRGGMLSDYVAHTRRFPDGSDRNVMTDESVAGTHATDLFSDWAVEYLNERAPDGSPFFLYLAYNAPHTPIQPPAEWVTTVKAREPGIAPKRAKLVALIEHMDAGVGRVLAALDGAGLRENTLVVFTSDNGGQLSAGANNGPFRGGKEDLYQGGLRVPCAVRWPGAVEPGATTDATALTMDWFPTLLNVSRVRDYGGRLSVPPDTDGIDLTGSMAQPDWLPDDRPLHFTRREGRPNQWAGQASHAVIAGGWKLVQNRPFDQLELFHIAEDPGETTDLIDSQPAKAKELGRLLTDHTRRNGAVPWEAPVVAE